MKTWRVPAIVLGVVYACFLVYLASSDAQLPERVATHFDLAGQPDGWMTRTTHLVFSAVLPLVLSLFLVGLFFAVRFFPDRAFSLRRRDYWLAPERRAETYAYFFRQSFWLASMLTGFIAGIHYLIVRANRLGGGAAHLSMPMTLAVAGCLLAGTAVWIGCMILHFRKTDQPHAETDYPDY